MKFVIFSDLHTEDYSVGQHRLEDCLSVIEKVFETAEKFGGHILFTGDLVDKAAALKSHVITSLYRMLSKCFYIYPDIEFIAISGNHDMTKRAGESGSSILELFHQTFPRFIHVDSFFKVQDTIIFGIPFYDKRELFLQHLESAKTMKEAFVTQKLISVLLTHQCDPATPFSDIFVEDTEGFDYTFNGHIHRYKQHTENFYTVGNPLWRNAADTGDSKGILFFDSLNGEVSRILLDFAEHSVKEAPKSNNTLYVAPPNLSNEELFDEYCKAVKVEPTLAIKGKTFI